MRRTVLAAVVLFAASANVVAQNLEEGAEVFKKCRACENAKSLLGPKLNGLFGRKAGSIEGFNYSDANNNSDVVWDEKTLANYVKDPRTAMPGNKMAFAGIKDEKDVADHSFLEDIWRGRQTRQIVPSAASPSGSLPRREE
jgi:cytochrome c